MSSPSPLNSDVSLSELGRRRLIKLMERLNYTIDELSEVSGLNKRQVQRARSGEKISRTTLDKLTKALKVSASDLLEPIDWVTYYSNRTREQLDLTALPILSREGTTPDWQDYWVDLDLEQRKPPSPRKGTNFRSHQGSDLLSLADVDVEATYSSQEFVESILAARGTQAPPLRVVFVGPLGVGKTSLMQQVAHWLLKHPEHGIAVYLSMSELEGFSVRRHLKSQRPLGKQISELDWQELETELTQGRVWLFLDGVDEAGVNVSAALTSLSSELKNWLAQANIVMSCRNNVWDGEFNPLRGKAEVYYVKPLQHGGEAQPDQVRGFIQKRFRDNPALGDGLRQRLDDPSSKSLRDLIRNPLCAEILCFIWKLSHQDAHLHLRQNQLPQTSIELYQTYVHYLFDVWKPALSRTVDFTLTPHFRAIQRLSLRALSEEVSPFRLRYSFLLEVWRSEELEPSWLDDLLCMGLLNLVGRAKENPLENVYALTHPVFQECFAALAISSYRELFCPDSRVYRALDPQFREVVFLYLERNIPAQEKEALLQSLTDCRDPIARDFCRGLFLVAAEVTRYRDFSMKFEVVDQVVRWSCGVFDSSTYSPLYSHTIERLSAQVLAETDAVQALESFEYLAEELSEQEESQQITEAQARETRLKIVERLRQVEGGRGLAYQLLKQFCASTGPIERLQMLPICYRYLQTYSPEDVETRDQIIALLASCSRGERLEDLADSQMLLRGIAPSILPSRLHQLFRRKLRFLRKPLLGLQREKLEMLRFTATHTLMQLEPEHPEILSNLNQLRQTARNDVVRKLAERDYRYITLHKPEVEQLLYGEGGYHRQYEAAEIDEMIEHLGQRVGMQQPIDFQVLHKLTMGLMAEEELNFVLQGERLIKLLQILKQVSLNPTALTIINGGTPARARFLLAQIWRVCSQRLPPSQLYSTWQDVDPDTV